MRSSIRGPAAAIIHRYRRTSKPKPSSSGILQERNSISRPINHPSSIVSVSHSGNASNCIIHRLATIHVRAAQQSRLIARVIRRRGHSREKKKKEERERRVGGKERERERRSRRKVGYLSGAGYIHRDKRRVHDRATNGCTCVYVRVYTCM